MASIYGINCAISIGGNTGSGPCPYNDKPVYGDILVPDGTEFPLAEFEGLVETLKDLAKNANRLLRIFPIFGYEEVEDKSEERQQAQKGYGNKFHTRDEIKAETYWIVGKSCVNRAAVKFQNQHQAFNRIIVFADGALSGVKTINADGEAVMKGFRLSELYPGSYKTADGTNPGQWPISYSHADINEWNNRIVVKPTIGNVLTDLKGLKDIELEWVKQASPVAAEFHIAATSSCGTVNISKIFATELASISLWKATKFPSGETITIESAAATPAGLTKITLDDTDVDFTSATRIKFELVNTTLLAAANLVGYECVTDPPLIVPNS